MSCLYTSEKKKKKEKLHLALYGDQSYVSVVLNWYSWQFIAIFWWKSVNAGVQNPGEPLWGYNHTYMYERFVLSLSLSLNNFHANLMLTEPFNWTTEQMSNWISDRTAANNWFIVELQQRIENLLTALTSYYIANANCYLLAHGLQPLTRRIRVACKKKKRHEEYINLFLKARKRKERRG